MKHQFLSAYKPRTAAAFCLLMTAAACATSPDAANLPQSVQRAPHLNSSFNAIQAAGESAHFLAKGKGQITFLAPGDTSCARVSELHRKNISESWAKTFVLSHTFHGQINVVWPDKSTRQVKVNLVSDNNRVTSIAEGGTLVATNFLGKDMPISIRDGVILVGNSAHLDPNSLFVSSTGSVGVIDYCHEL